jgi:hypothetical protein
VRLLAEFHEEVACLLGGPFPGRMPRDSEDADTPGRVFYHRQDVGLGAVEQVDCKEIARQDPDVRKLADRRWCDLRPFFADIFAETVKLSVG